jgi:hypothetical protein
MHCMAVTLGLQLGGGQDFIRRYSWELSYKTLAVTTVYIHIVLYNKHRLVVIRISVLLLLSLSHTCCSRLCKVCSVLMIVFCKCYYIECVFFYIYMCMCVRACARSHVCVCVHACVYIYYLKPIFLL